MKLLICVAIFISVISNVVANVNSQWYYECLFDGERHGHEIACNRYYECRGNAVTGYTIYLYKCPQGYLYNGAVNTCQVGFCDFPPSPTTTLAPTTLPAVPTTEAESETTTEDYDETEETTTENYNETEKPTTTEDYDETEEPTTEELNTPTTTTTRRPRPPFVCRESGTFVDTQDCNKFHDCDCNSEGVCQDTVLTCPPNFHFCEGPGVCAVAGFCACEADLIM